MGQITLSYVLHGTEHLIHESDENILIEKRETVTGQETEIGLVIKNISAENVFLKYAVLWESSDLEDAGVGKGPYEVYRSGRHKNDMPGTFTLGVCDERMKDVMGGMTETGDKEEAEEDLYQIFSDHLTVIQGDKQSLLVMFPGGRKQLFETVLTLDSSYELKQIAAKVLFQVILPANKAIESEELKLVRTDDVQGEIDRFAQDKALRFGSRSGVRPSVFCTWYYYGLTVTYEDVKTNLEIIKEKKLPFDVFQVDEGWEITLGEWKPNGKFPVPMKQVADEIRDAGYRPGIWTSPFIAHETASIWEEHPEWKLKDKAGKPCLFHMNDTVYHVFDITNPATYTYFTDLYQMLTDEWGFTYHKLDFTRAGVIYEDAAFYDQTITLAEAYYKAVCAIREGMGQESYFLMCGGLYDPTVGLVDAQRTGSDVLSMWSSTINKNGKTAPYTIKQSVMRYYMNRWWDNDPDALMVRRNKVMERDLRLTYGLLNDEEVKTSVMNQFMGGGIMCSTEPMDKIDEERLLEYRRIMPVAPTRVSPLNLMERQRFPGMVDVYGQSEDVHYLCMVNWEDEQSVQPQICIGQIWPGYGEPEDEYLICDYYAGEVYKDVKGNDVITLEPVAPHGALLVKVCKKLPIPVVIRSNGHYAMGREFTQLEMRGGRLHYVVENPYDYHLKFDVLLPDGREVCVECGRGKHEGCI